jgi:hypothetical protein
VITLAANVFYKNFRLKVQILTFTTANWSKEIALKRQPNLVILPTNPAVTRAKLPSPSKFQLDYFPRTRVLIL